MSRRAVSIAIAVRKSTVRPLTNVSNRRRYLLANAFAQSTLTKYIPAVQQFVAWCLVNGEDPVDAAEMDDVLTDYLHHLFETGGGRAKANNTYYGLISQRPSLRHGLPASLQCLRGFGKLLPSTSYPPVTWEIAVVIAVQLWRHDCLRSGIATLLAFDCLLRIGELLALRKEDIAFPGDHRLPGGYSSVLVRLRKTKTGRNQSVVVRNVALRSLLFDLVNVTGDRQLLFPFSPNVFRSRFKLVCRELGLDSNYVPHSLRHGGATTLHLDGWKVEDILLRGRWESTKAARRYIQAGRAVLMSVQVPSNIASLARVFAADLLTSFTLAQSH